MYVKVSGIHRVRKRLADGSVAAYCYAWRGGPRMTAPYGTREFSAEWHVKVAERKRPPAGIFFTLIAEYKASSAYTGKREATRHNYARYLKLIEARFGTVPIAALSDPRMRGDFMAWRDGMADKKRKADLAWTVLARVLSFAKDRGRIPVNVCERGGRLYKADRTDVLWTEDMIGTIRAEFPPHLRSVFMLALYTGQRVSDLLALPWSGYRDGRIRLRQGKGGRRVSIPVAAALREEIARIAKRGPIMLTSSEGRPWTYDGFSASWRKECKRQGIGGATFHDIRGTAVTRLAEAGCPTAEIATITGHSLRDVDAILDAHYLSRTDVLADAAIRRLDEKEQRTAAVNQSVNRSAADG